MSFKWSAPEEHLLKILLPTASYEEIAVQIEKRRKLMLPGFGSERTAEAVRKKCDRDELTAENCKNYLEKNPYQEHWDRLFEIQNEYREQSIERGRGRPKSVYRKIFAISDIHMPIARQELLEEIIDEHSDADVCVVNGDLMDGFVYSTFEKAKSISGLHEYQASFELIEILSKIFPDVVLIDGNHDVRAAKTLKRNGMSSDATQVLRPNFMARIANGERLDDTGLVTERVKFNNVHYNARESWYERIGKTIFAHPHTRGSSKPGFTAEKVYRYFRNRYDTEDFDSVVVGHCHQLFWGILDGYLLMEQGSLVDLLEYAHEPSLRYTTNTQTGYAVVYQDENGNTDFNLSRPIHLGEAMPPKKALNLLTRK